MGRVEYEQWKYWGSGMSADATHAQLFAGCQRNVLQYH